MKYLKLVFVLWWLACSSLATAMYFDQESGLNYNGNRSYRPPDGRYTQPDPIGWGGGSNPFIYVDANPLTYVDPDGLAKIGRKPIDLEPLDGGGGGGIGVGGGSGRAYCPPAAKEATGWKLGPNDLDFRGSGKGIRDALDTAFERIGRPRGEFEVTRWGRDADGKSFPAEWRHKSGAEVNVDRAHANNGPAVPHVGFQAGGKRGDGGAIRGHILLDDVPFNR